MKIHSLVTLVLPIAAHSLALMEDSRLEERKPVSRRAEWCTAVGTLLTGVGTMAGAGAAWYAAVNSQQTCATKEKTLHDKRESFDAHALLSQSMMFAGFEPIERSEFFNESDTGHGLDTAHFSDGITDIIVGNATDGGSIATIGTRPNLESRTASVGLVRMSTKVFGDPPTFFNCHTTATQQEFKAALDDVLGYVSSHRCASSCFVLDHDGNWRDAVKIEEHRHDAPGYYNSDRKCHGYALA